MNYLLIGGADCRLKIQAIHQYAQMLQKSADFDLVKNSVPDKSEERFWCVFTNRITQRSVLVNNMKLTPDIFTDIEHFKSNYPPSDTVVTLIPSPDAPERHALMENFDVMPDDNAVEISLDNIAEPHGNILQGVGDKIEDILSNPPFNLL